jgi:hypothetical protein
MGVPQSLLNRSSANKENIPPSSDTHTLTTRMKKKISSLYSSRKFKSTLRGSPLAKAYRPANPLTTLYASTAMQNSLFNQRAKELTQTPLADLSEAYAL